MSLKFQYSVPFTMIDSAVLVDETLSVYDKTVYAVLCTYASNTDKSCYPSYQTIARKAGCSRSKTIEVMAKLEELGLIEKQIRMNSKGENTSNLYTVKTTSPQSRPPSGTVSALPSPQKIPPNPPCIPELYPFNDIQSNEKQSSIKDEDRLEVLKSKINYSWFEEEMPSKLAFVDSLLGYIFELEQEAKPETVRLIAAIDDLAVLEFLDEIKGKSFANVKNFGGYIKKVLVEFLRRREIELATI